MKKESFFSSLEATLQCKICILQKENTEESTLQRLQCQHS